MKEYSSRNYDMCEYCGHTSNDANFSPCGRYPLCNCKYLMVAVGENGFWRSGQINNFESDIYKRYLDAEGNDLRQSSNRTIADQISFASLIGFKKKSLWSKLKDWIMK